MLQLLDMVMLAGSCGHFLTTDNSFLSLITANVYVGKSQLAKTKRKWLYIVQKRLDAVNLKLKLTVKKLTAIFSGKNPSAGFHSFI